MSAAPSSTASSALAHGSPRVVALASDLQRVTRNTAHFAVRASTGDVTFIGASANHPLQVARADDDDSSDAARRFVDTYGTMFGVDDAGADLTQLTVFDGEAGDAVRFQQRYEGLPVIAGQVAVQVDDSGNVVSATGEASPQLDIPVASAISAEQASATALTITARASGVPTTDLVVSAPELSVYDPELISAPDAQGPRIVWRMDVRTPVGDVDRLVLIDANDGSVALQFSQQEEAGLNRVVCNEAGGSDLPCGGLHTTIARTEGSAASGDPDVDAAYVNAGVTYNFYVNSFARDSIDGHGLPIVSTVNYCPSLADCPYHNAFWNGEQMVYGADYAKADDVVGHELTHGVTQYTSGLFYYADTGAINESMSDVMGELIDQGSTLSGPDPPTKKWLLGEDLFTNGSAFRSMSDPRVSPFFDPDRMTSTLFVGTIGDNYGVHSNSGVSNKAAFLITDGTPPGTPFNGQTITGIGPAKTAQIYYYANTTLLTPGSDYLDLFSILPQACTNLVGTAGITAPDCTQVTKAVTATEMNKRATKAGATLTAPVCDSGSQATVPFSDSMEANGPWASTQTGSGTPWQYSTAASQSGARSLHVIDSGGAGTSTITLQTPVALPAAQSAFVRFDHSFSTDSNSTNLMYDGGVVEYTIDGSTWTDINTLPVVNGYVTTIQNGFSNPLQGRLAFGIISPNFETTRVNLSALAGQSVRLRFTFATDNFTEEFPGWFIDDVSIYTCTSLPGAPQNVVGAAGDSSVTVSWTPPPDGGSAITGYTLTTFVNGVAQNSFAVPGTSTSASVTGLTNGTQYTFTVTATNVMGTGPPSAASSPVTPAQGFISFVPARLMDTRSGHSTIDGGFNGIGVRTAGSVTSLNVLGRGGIGADAAAVVLNVTVTEAAAAGFVTVYPCGGNPPTASSLNYVQGSTIPNAVFVQVGTNGQVCLFTQSDVHLIVDANGYFPAGSSLSPLVPGRLLDSRSGQPTADGQGIGIGPRPAGSVTEVQVGGRAGVPADASAAALNVTVTDPQAPGFITVYPCGGDPPLASNLNYAAGATIANAVVTKIGAGGKVCVLTQASIQLIVDVNGFAPMGSRLVPIVPARVLETRGSRSTVDGLSNGIGQPGAGSVTIVQVAGRAGIPANATAVVLNVTVTESSAPGFATVYPCGGDPPTASSLNYGTGTTIANAVITRVAADGTVCLFTQSATHLLADVNAYFSS